ncbi:hypothetical protein BC828DRAFT_391109 [Blastocladiella britannica]|nr:hypothetical protein BC828DRAFT_391109 [Blastocladiella britannica]
MDSTPRSISDMCESSESLDGVVNVEKLRDVDAEGGNGLVAAAAAAAAAAWASWGDDWSDGDDRTYTGDDDVTVVDTEPMLAVLPCISARRAAVTAAADAARSDVLVADACAAEAAERAALAMPAGRWVSAAAVDWPDLWRWDRCFWGWCCWW